METLKHGLELYQELLPKYKAYFETGSPSFGNCLWQLLVNETWRDRKPHCFVSVYNDGLVLGIAEHGECGYYNTHVHFVNGINYDQAETILEKLNEEMFGLLVRAQAEIILTSLRNPSQPKFEGKDAQTVWNELVDVPVTNDMEIDEDFYHFGKGTDCNEIWAELEEYFNITVGEMHVTHD